MHLPFLWISLEGEVTMTHATLDIQGMSCGGCSSSVQTALTRIDGVVTAEVSHSTGKAQVDFDAARTSTEALVAAVDELGYEARVAAT